MKFIFFLIAHTALFSSGYYLALHDNKLTERDSFIYKILEGEE